MSKFQLRVAMGGVQTRGFVTQFRIGDRQVAVLAPTHEELRSIFQALHPHHVYDDSKATACVVSKAVQP